MNLYTLERKFGRFAIKNLSFYVTVVFAAGWLMLNLPIGRYLYYELLVFMPDKVLHGQIWRILTTLIYPVSFSGLLMSVLVIWVYYSLASSVERSLGSFEFNLYFFGSILISEAGSLIYYLFTGISRPFYPVFAYFSVMMAFSVLYPDAEFYIMFVLPMKARVLAVIELVIYVFNFLRSGSYDRIMIICALIPVYLMYSRYGKGQKGLFESLRSEWEERRRRKKWRDQWKN